MPVSHTWNADRASEIIAQHRELEGPLLPILHALQDEFGYIDAAGFIKLNALRLRTLGQRKKKLGL